MQRNTYICGWLFLLGMLLSTSLFAQAPIQFGAQVSVGSSSMLLDSDAVNTNSGALGLQLGLFLQYKVTDNFYIGTGFGLANYGGSLGLDAYNETISGEPSIFEVNTPASYDRLISASNITEEVALSFLRIPLYGQYVFGSGSDATFRPFIGAGLDIGLTMSGSSYTGRATSSYRGVFETVQEGAKVELFDIPEYGFKEGVVLNEEKAFEALTGTNIGLLLTAGAYLNINENLKFRAGVRFVQGINNLSGYDPDSYVLSYGEGDYTTLVGKSSKASTRFIGLELGLVYDLGNGPAPCPPSKFETIPIRYVQQSSNRRDPGRMDPEFEKIAPEIRPLLAFSPKSFQIRPESSGISYCTQGDASPERITVEVRGRHSYLSLDRFDSRFEPLSDSFLVSLSVRHDAVLRLTLQDEDTESPIDEFQVKLYMGRDLVLEKTMNSGDAIYDLYDHPRVAYTLQIKRECYPDQTIELDRAQDLNTNKVVTVAATGTSERLDLPLQASDIKGRERLQARFGTNALSGNVGPSAITLYAPCGQEMGENLSLSIEKPLGYDILAGASGDNWKEENVSVQVVDGKPVLPLRVERLPKYHFFYVDISEAEDRAIILDTLEARLIKATGDRDKYLAYLSNGLDPTVAEIGDEYEDVLIDITRTFTDPPAVAMERDQILKQLTQEKVAADRRITVFNFFLSRTIYQQSRNELITRLTENFGDDQRNIQINIYTDYAIAESDKLPKGQYQTPIRYIQLK